jgi:dihydrofolate reductase
LDEALARARQAADGRDVYSMGGADVIRQALRAGYLDELAITTAPVALGGGKRLFDGFDESLPLEQTRMRQSPFVTHLG